MTSAMGVKGNTRVELIIYIIVILCIIGGVGLCVSGLLVPNWVLVTYNENIVIIKGKVGLWRTELCDYQGCKTYWRWDSAFDDHPKADFNSRGDIRGIETAGTIVSVVALFSLIPRWFMRHRSRCARIWAQVFFFTQSISAAFLCVTGALMVSAKMDHDDVDWAPFLSGSGSALLFIGAILSCVQCRFDKTFGTSEDPVSKDYKTEGGDAPKEGKNLEVYRL